MNMKPHLLVLLLSCFLLSQPLKAALQPPEIKCVEVLANFDVLLHWEIPPDPTSVFDEYQIYYSTSIAGPYNLLGSVNNYAQNSFLHVNANAHIQILYYYIVTRSDAPVYSYSIPSDTMASMRLVLSNPGNGTAVLNWNAMTQAAPLTVYEIFYEAPAGVWNFSGSTSNLNYVDTIYYCNQLIQYRIEVQDISGCKSISSADKSIFQNLIPPETPTLDSVSVDQPTQNAVLGWQISASGDTEGYIIYQFLSGIWTPIDTVWGAASNAYTNSSSSADNASESYSIAAIDSCGITSPICSPHSSIFLDAQLDVCADLIRLSWNDYIGMNPMADTYQLFSSVNGGPFSLITNLAPGMGSFDYAGLTDGSSYCFIMRATNSDGISSSSNLVCVNVVKPQLPSFTYLRYATVLDNGDIALACFLDSTVEVQGYMLQRAIDTTAAFTDIDFISYNGFGSFNFIDPDAISDHYSYFYRMMVVDSCGNLALASNYARSVFLEGEADAELYNNLFWNPYEKWPSGVENYFIERRVDGITDPSSPVSILPSSNSFIDDVSVYILSEGDFSYRITAIENALNPFGFIDTVRSNWVSIQQLPRLYIPNAFAPDGFNNTFKPLGVFIDHSSYSFTVFNKLGEEMFYTTDFFEPWDGYNDGSIVPLGVYVYILTLTLPSGFEFEKRGIITVVR